MDQWRLIEHGAGNGAHNMAVDHAILDAVIAGSAAPTLRLYAWEPTCLSLGFGQRAREVDLERLAAHGFTLVRRPTGGGAVLHADELTYSLALPDGHSLAAGGVLDSYRRISAGLIAALNALDLDPQLARRGAGLPAPHLSGAPVCFETPSDYEITCDGRKLVGSAQLRRRGGILQHGSIPLNGDIAAICEVLRYDSEAAREKAQGVVRRRATTLTAVLSASAPGHPVRFAQLATALATSMAATYGVTLQTACLSTQEEERAAELAATVYGCDDWTFRR